MKIFTIPKICPICGGDTKIIVSDSGVENLICDNPQCQGKLINRLDHYAGKKGLDIKGLSKATLEKLIDWEWVSSISDLYRLKDRKIEWGNKPGFGDKSVANILEAIENSKNCSLEAFISACGIPLIGRTIAKELCNHFDSWESFREYINSNKSFEEFYGFGYEMDKSLKDFDFTELDNIKKNFLTIENNVKSKDEKLKGKIFVITGKLFTYKNRDAIKADIEGKGGKVASAISSKTSFLINNDINSTSSKNKKAKDLGIPIITEQDFINNYC